MSDEEFTVVEEIGEDNILAFRNTASIAIDIKDKTVKTR